MKILDEHMLGEKNYLCGDKITLADYLGAEIVAVGDIIRCDYSLLSQCRPLAAPHEKS